MYSGIPASPGLAIGPALVITKTELKIEQRTVSDPQAELERLKQAVEIAQGQIETLKAKAIAEVGAEEGAIFEAHGMLLADPALEGMVRASVEEQRVNVEYAWQQAIESFAQQMESMEDEYFKARAADIRDVGERVLRILAGDTQDAGAGLTQPSIIVARDLTPSDTIHLDKALVLGFCTAEGGPTSHTVILAKALGLPAIVAAGDGVLQIASGTSLILDAEKGEVLVSPDEAALAAAEKRQQSLASLASEEKALAGEAAVTQDGHRVEVVANIGGPEDAKTALEFGAEGVGLLRTEFIYLERSSAPNEEEQYAIYRDIMEVMGTRPVVARTLDVGGDKEIPYLDLGTEANPFLGWRAVRMCLDNPELYKTQLRALLRAADGHDLRIMVPMISSLDEVRRAKTLLAEAAEEAQAAGHKVGQVQTGIMVEIPSVAVMADQFAAEVDFFSIGTNDLTQYTFAADRTNQKVAHLADACHPAVLRQIAQVIEAAHAAGIWVGLCGELAGDPNAAPVLLGLGLDEFSMAPALIPHAKAVLRSWSLADAQKLAQQALQQPDGDAVRALVRGRQ